KAACRDDGFLVLLADLVDLLEAAEDLGHGGADDEEVADLDFVAVAIHEVGGEDDEAGGGGQEGELAAGGDAADDGDEVFPEADGIHDAVKVEAGGGVVLGDFRGLGGEGLDDVDAGNV